MKGLKIEIRLFIAEILLGISMKIAPKESKDGKRIVVQVKEYFDGFEMTIPSFKD